MTLAGSSIASWCLLAAALLPYSVVPFAKAGGTYDNADPRNPKGYDTPLKQRAMAAQANGFEALAVFAPAVLLALISGADTSWLHTLCLIWLAARIVYNICYLTGLAMARSLVWLVAWGCAIAIYALAL
jgi:uncharacterized MAPEG superfamily protein